MLSISYWNLLFRFANVYQELRLTPKTSAGQTKVKGHGCCVTTLVSELSDAALFRLIRYSGGPAMQGIYAKEHNRPD
jgi:hypothetical protein